MSDLRAPGAAAFDRLYQVEPAVNTVPTTCRERAEAAAREQGATPADTPGWLGGLPVGLQLIGQPRGEAALLAVARFVELACGGPLGPIDPVNRRG